MRRLIVSGLATIATATAVAATGAGTGFAAAHGAGRAVHGVVVADTGWGNAGCDPLEPGCPLPSPHGV